MSYSDFHVRSARLEDDVPPEGVPDITTGAEVAHDEFGRAKLALGHNASFGHHDAYQCLDEQRRMMLPSAPAAPPPVPYSYAMVDENNTSISCRVQPDVHSATIVKRSTTNFATRNEVDVVSSHKYRSLVARSGGTLVEAVRWSIGDRDTVVEMAVPFPHVPFPSDPHAPPQPCHLPPRRGDLYELVMWGSSSSDHVPPGDRAAWIAMLRACFRDVALAVALLHDGGFVHRDIKLENVVFVFVEARPATATSNVDESLGSWLGRHQVHAQLIDMAFVVSDCDRHAPTKSGTRGYLPADLCQMYIVEIAPTWRQLAAADVFGLGMMMCNALCGRNEGSRSLQQQCAQLPFRVSAFRRQLSGQSLAWVAGNLLHEDWSVRPLARLVFEWLHGGPS